MLERQDHYRQLRVVIDVAPSGSYLALTVVARVSHRGTHHDRLLLSRRLDTDLNDRNVMQVLREAGQLLTAEALRMGRPTPQAPSTQTPLYRRVV